MSTPKFNNDNVTEVLYMAAMDATEIYSLEGWGDSASLIDSPLTKEEIDRILQECDITITDEERTQLTTMAGAIVYSDSQGLVSYDGFVTNDALFGHWANIESDYYPEEDEDEDLLEDEDEDQDEEPVVMLATDFFYEASETGWSTEQLTKHRTKCMVYLFDMPNIDIAAMIESITTGSNSILEPGFIDALYSWAGVIVTITDGVFIGSQYYENKDELFLAWDNLLSEFNQDNAEFDQDEDKLADEEPEVDYKDAEAVSLKEFVWLAVQNGRYSEICQNPRKPDTYPMAYKIANPYTRETIYKKVLLESQYMRDEDVNVLADNMLGLVYIQYNDHSVVNVAYLDGELEEYWSEAVKLVIQSYQS